MPSGFSCRWKGAPASILKDEKDFVIGVLWKIPISELAELDIQGKRVEKIIKELRTVAYGTKSLKFNIVENGGANENWVIHLRGQ